jgi:hypothetical protein
MKYAVLVDFIDLEDNRLYRKGDQYPRTGIEPDKKRIDELSGSGNRIGKPLIKAVKEAEKAAADDGKVNNQPKQRRAVKQASEAEKPAPRKTKK